MDMKSVGHTIGSIPSKIKEYAKPRPETQEDLGESSPVSASIAGAVEGFIAGGPVVSAAGAVGGYLGVKAGEEGSVLPAVCRGVDKMINAIVPGKEDIRFARRLGDKFISQGSFMKAIGNGAAVGAAVSTLALAGIAAVAGAPVAATTLVAGGILGGLSGVAGTLSGSRKSTTRDGVYGGYLTGMLAGTVTGNPTMMIAGAAAGGIGGKAAKPIGRALLGALAGLVTGALTGVFGGPAGMATGAVTGALVGAAGAVAGPPVRQIMRNATDDIANAATKKLGPSVKNKIGTKGKVSLGALAGALSLAPLGLIFGPLVGGVLVGLGIGAGAGALMGSLSTYKMVKSQEAAEALKKEQLQVQAEVREWKAAQPGEK
ncbi:MAG: hypothetical protein RDV48_16195 [Candidatus Eremiobacteraeota bacterium]|nr:hypothetical protein [Candidatus Eremiobacteraeota bacterium]